MSRKHRASRLLGLRLPSDLDRRLAQLAEAAHCSPQEWLRQMIASQPVSPAHEGEGREVRRSISRARAERLGLLAYEEAERLLGWARHLPPGPLQRDMRRLAGAYADDAAWCVAVERAFAMITPKPPSAGSSRPATVPPTGRSATPNPPRPSAGVPAAENGPGRPRESSPVGARLGPVPGGPGVGRRFDRPPARQRMTAHSPLPPDATRPDPPNDPAAAPETPGPSRDPAPDATAHTFPAAP